LDHIYKWSSGNHPFSVSFQTKKFSIESTREYKLIGDEEVEEIVRQGVFGKGIIIITIIHYYLSQIQP
jgi:hypothetical protein